jgi:8-oxo-dGTP diphosphatase
MKLATLCYVQKDNQTLMLHRNSRSDDAHYGKYNGLGGKFEPGETPEECVKREVFEESGLVLHKVQLKGFLTFPAFSKGEDWYVFVFTSGDFSGDLLTNTPEGQLEWVDNGKIPTLNMWEGDEIFLPWLERAGIFSGKFEYTNGRLVSHKAELY